MAAAAARPTLSAYRHLLRMQTRWADNDQYGHVNNVIYYSYMDTIVNHFLITVCNSRPQEPPSHTNPVGLVVHSQCEYFEPLSYPETVTLGLRVDRIGTSSVTYGIGVFGVGERCAARGSFTHVYVDAERRPRAVDRAFRDRLQTLLLAEAAKI